MNSSKNQGSVSRSINAIELFCGAGGTSLGFELAGGYRSLLGMDIDPDAMATFEENHPNSQCLLGDITVTKPTTVSKMLKGSNVDIIIGGPSCQGYSTIGKRIEDDPRNSLYEHYLKYIDEFRPRWIVFENVRGFLHCGKGKFYRDFCDALAKLGYDVASAMVNAADYGVPQRRVRVIVIGTNSGLEPSLPSPTHDDPRCVMCSRPDNSNRIRSRISRENCKACSGSGFQHAKGLLPWVSVQDAIGDLSWLSEFGGTEEFLPYSSPTSSSFQKLMRSKSKGYDLHRAQPVSKFALSVISKIPQGGGIRSIADDDLPDRFKIMRKVKNGSLRKDCTTLYGRLEWTMPAYTITCYFGNVASGAFTHPEVHRSLTVREAARLQSFPDRYRICRRNARRQVGNAVPPLLAKSIANHIKRIESGERPATRSGTSVNAPEKQLVLFT
jgi:DNA (cytosine-5)-methyltransferase 1